MTTQKAKKFHTDVNGNPQPCSASVRSCPRGGANDHYPTPEAAREAFEKKNNAATLAVLSKQPQGTEPLAEWEKELLGMYEKTESALADWERELLDYEEKAIQREMAYEKYQSTKKNYLDARNNPFRHQYGFPEDEMTRAAAEKKLVDAKTAFKKAAYEVGAYNPKFAQDFKDIETREEYDKNISILNKKAESIIRNGRFADRLDAYYQGIEQKVRESHQALRGSQYEPNIMEKRGYYDDEAMRRKGLTETYQKGIREKFEDPDTKNPGGFATFDEYKEDDQKTRRSEIRRQGKLISGLTKFDASATRKTKQAIEQERQVAERALYQYENAVKGRVESNIEYRGLDDFSARQTRINDKERQAAGNHLNLVRSSLGSKYDPGFRDELLSSGDFTSDNLDVAAEKVSEWALKHPEYKRKYHPNVLHQVIFEDETSSLGVRKAGLKLLRESNLKDLR